MGVKANINREAIRAALEKEVERNLNQVIAVLQYVGETIVNQIRTSDISYWEDQTGNLRSSIGYIVCVDGKVVGESDFALVDGPKRGQMNEEDGSQVGKDFAHSLVASFPKGIALIVVAGMEYAPYVEKLHNRTVLAQGEIEAGTLIDKMLKALQAQRKTKA